MFNDLLNNLPIFLMRIPVILLSLTFHEIAHGWVASKLGDPTAKNLGRLSINPLHHLDPIGTVMMLLFGFGWAKPVPINARYFKNIKRDMALTALAGPVTNFILGFIGVFLHMLFMTVLYDALVASNALAYVIILFFKVFYTLNLYLGVFNLLPVPPLDGSRIIFAVLPDKYYFGIMKYERYIMLFMMLFLFTGMLSRPLSVIVFYIETVMKTVIGFLPFL